MATKARLYKTQALPPEYAGRFCHPTGVDHQFISFFGLDPDSFLEAVDRDDSGLVDWFLSQAGVTMGKIADWNHLAVNLGRRGFPMAERLPIALASTYKHLNPSSITSVFEAIELDESPPHRAPVR